MKKIFASLTALAICGALNFGLTTEAQAAEAEFFNPSGTEYNEVSKRRHWPPRYGAPRPDYRQPPPPPPPYYWNDDDWYDDRYVQPPPPPPPGWGAQPPPPGWDEQPPPPPPPVW